MTKPLFGLSVLVVISPLIFGLCGGASIDAKQVSLQYSYSAGIIRGSIRNDSSSTISSIKVDVDILGDRNQVISTRQGLTIRETVRPQKTEDFQLNVGGTGRNARIRILEIH